MLNTDAHMHVDSLLSYVPNENAHVFLQRTSKTTKTPIYFIAFALSKVAARTSVAG